MSPSRPAPAVRRPEPKARHKEIGFREYGRVGKQIPGVPYPVCRAEQLQREFRDTTFKDEGSTRKYFGEYQALINLARGAPPEERGKYVGKARQALETIKRMVKNNPNFASMVMGMLPARFKIWCDEQEDLLRELMKK